MKNLILFFFILSVLISCASKNEEEARNTGQEIYFSETNYDFGEIKEDSEGLYKIKFKNISDSAVVINRVRSTCGCTIPSWPREPIAPGTEGDILVKYNTALVGSFVKSVYVYSSAANSPVKLIVKGKVIPKEKLEEKSEEHARYK